MESKFSIERLIIKAGQETSESVWGSITNFKKG